MYNTSVKEAIQIRRYPRLQRIKKSRAKARLSVCNQQSTLCRTLVVDDDWRSEKLRQDQEEDADMSFIIRWKNEGQRQAGQEMVRYSSGG